MPYFESLVETTNLGFLIITVDYLFYMIPAMLLALLAQGMVRSAFAKYSQVPLRKRISGQEVARRVLEHAGVQGVSIERARGFLSDHYDPRHQVIRLSEANYDGHSIAAAAIAAHEAGHAIQKDRKYAPLALRSLYVPVAAFGGRGAIPLLLIGFIFSMEPLFIAGIALFSAVVLFQLITLPVEFDASRRAKLVLAESGIIVDDEEARGVSKVLTAAAMTYVAAAIQSILTLLYYLSLFSGRRN